MKRVLAVLLCLCLLIPTMGLTLVQDVAAASVTRVDVPYYVNSYGKGSTTSVGTAFTFDPIDLTQLGFPTDGSKPTGLYLEFDIYVNGEDENGSQVAWDSFDAGQIEFCSSGTNDVEEYAIVIPSWIMSYGNWKTQTIDLSGFGYNGGQFDPSAFNFMRMFFTLNFSESCEYRIQICNVRITTAPNHHTTPLQNQTALEDPTWNWYTSGGEQIVAGYNLQEYVTKYKNELGTITDYSPVIQSLVDKLTMAGGGALYIPTGHYPCYTPITMRTGVSIYGDWSVPDGKSAISGTVIDVYHGEGSVNGIPFIFMADTSMIKNLAFWYPEQDINNLKLYSPTVSLSEDTWAKNITFVNSCMALKQGPSYENCPNAQNIYGTPLVCGMDLGYIIDIMRVESVDFSADYWIHSGLPGAPSSLTDAATLRGHLYNNATGVRLGRIDWSYCTYTTVDGYAIGVEFADHPSGAPNGQCHSLTLKNCKVGLHVERVSTTGEMVSHSTFDNCEYGVWLSPQESAVEGAILHLINVDITATEHAVYNQQLTMVQLLSSRVHSGTVTADDGWYTVVNTKFESAEPQVVLQSGARSAVLAGNTNATGGAITVSNLAGCAVSQSNETVDVAKIPTFTEAEAKEQNKAPTGSYKVIVSDLDTTGNDVTAALQAKLDAAQAAGGGLVYLTNGHYRINGSITIPTGVELRGGTDFGRLPYDCGAVLDLYSSTSTDPSIILSESSGIRGVTIWYPKQAHSDTFMTDHKFTEYPYAIQGRGSNVWIVNVAMRNPYNGVDLGTYRCDNHYVDYLGGATINNMIYVGGGSANGVIRNSQIKQGGFESETNRGDWSTEALPDDMTYIVYTNSQNNATIIKVGDVDNQLLYQTMNFGGYQGILLDSSAADARLIGCAMDYTTVCVDVQQAERLDVLNLQMVSYHNTRIIGPNYEDGSSRLTRDMHFIRLGQSCTATVNVTGLIFWDNPTWCVEVKGGTLNLYGLNYFSTHANFARMSDSGTVNVVAAYLKRTSLILGDSNLDRVHFQAGYYWALPTGYDTVGDFKQMLHTGVTALEDTRQYTMDFTSGELIVGSGIEAGFTLPEGGTESFQTVDGITGFGPTGSTTYERYYINVGADARYYNATARTTFKVTMKYYNPGTGVGSLVLQYASGTTQKDETIDNGSTTAGWNTATYVIEDAYFTREVLNGHDLRPSFGANSAGWLMAYITVEPLTYGAVDYNTTATAINDMASYDATYADKATYSDPAGGTTALMNSSTNESFITKVNYDATKLGVSGSDGVTVLVSYYTAQNCDWNYLSIGKDQNHNVGQQETYRGRIETGSSAVYYDAFTIGQWAVARCDFTHSYLGGSVTIRTKNHGGSNVYIGRVVVMPTAALDSGKAYAAVDFNADSSLNTYFAQSANPTDVSYDVSRGNVAVNPNATHTTFEGQNALKFAASATQDQTILTMKLSPSYGASLGANATVLVSYYLDGNDTDYADTLKLADKNKTVKQTMGVQSQGDTAVGELAGGTGDTGWQVACFHINPTDYASYAFKLLSGNTARDLYIGRIVVIPTNPLENTYGDDIAYLDADVSRTYLSYFQGDTQPATNIMAIAATEGSTVSATAQKVTDIAGKAMYAYTAGVNSSWYFRLPESYAAGDIYVTMTYLSQDGNIVVESGSSVEVSQGNTGRWCTVSLKLTDALMNNTLTNGADLKIGSTTGRGLTVASVAVSTGQLYENFRVSGAQLEVTDNFKVMFYSTNPRELVAAELGCSAETLTCGIQYSFNGLTDVYVEANDSAAAEVCFEIGNISPDLMNEKFTLIPVYKVNGEVVKQGEEMQYSIEDYCLALKDSYSDLALALLNYGAAVQRYRNPSLTDEDTVLAQLSTAEQAEIRSKSDAITAASIHAPDVAMLGKPTDERATWATAALIISDGVKLKFTVDAPNGVSGLKMKITDLDRNEEIADTPLTLMNGTTRYQATGMLPTPAHISDTLCVVIYDTSTGEAVSKTLIYSVSAYVESKLDDSDENLQRLVRALILYERAVEGEDITNDLANTTPLPDSPL